MPLDNAEVWKSDEASASDVACAPAKAMLFGAVAFGICLMNFYFAYPRFDLSVGRALYVQPHRFVGSESLFFGSLRNGFSTLFCAVCVLAGVGCVASLINMRNI